MAAGNLSCDGDDPTANNTTASTTTDNDDNATVQIRCSLDAKLRLFQVLQATGKALLSGGFGFSIPRKWDSSPSASKVDGDYGQNTPNQTRDIKEYLFIEETFFLHERGLLQCQDPQVDSRSLDTSQLFQLLPQLDLSLPVYLVYAHLRSQDFRVLRHSPGRLDLLKRQQELKAIQGDGIRRQLANLRHLVRSSIAEAPPPSIPADGGIAIAWDAYQPNSQFAKTNPGPPDFYVAVTYYNKMFVNFAQLEELATKESNGIPVKVAAVSDSGTVVMFGVTNEGVPCIGEN